MPTNSDTKEKPTFLDTVKDSTEAIKKFVKDDKYREEKVTKWRQADLEVSSNLLQSIAQGKENIKEWLSGEIKNGIPSHEKILEVKENAPHEVHLGISTEICKQAFKQKFPPDGKLPKLDELGSDFNFPKAQRNKGLPQATTREPEIFIDIPKSNAKKGENTDYDNPKELFVVIKTNNNLHKNKSTVVVATVKLNAEGQPMWDGKEFDGRGVFSTMTEKQYNERCKGKDEHAKWLRGESTIESHLKNAKVAVIENGQPANKTLEEYWKEHDQQFTLTERHQHRKTFQEAIVNLEQIRLASIDRYSTEMADKTKLLDESLRATNEDLPVSEEVIENLMIIMLTEHQINYPKEPLTVEQLIAIRKKLGLKDGLGRIEQTLRKLGFKTQKAQVDSNLKRVGQNTQKMNLLKLWKQKEDELGLTIEEKTAEQIGVQKAALKYKARKIMEE